MDTISKDIIKTCSYGHIFSYPLTLLQIHKYIISKHTHSLDEIKKALHLIDVIEHKRGYYFIQGNNEFVKERKKREREGKKKLVKARKVAKILSYIPFIKLIGISGSLAMNNASRDDDIDLFIITQKNTLWISRICITVILLLLKAKRKRGEKVVKDKICVNMIMELDNLCLAEKNIYTAHEIAQVKILINKNQTFERFIHCNVWIKKYIPNYAAWGLSRFVPGNDQRSSFDAFFLLLNRACFYLQYLYMKNHITQEKVSLHKAKFHPDDKTHWVIRSYLSAVEKYTKNYSFQAHKTHRSPLYVSYRHITPGS